MKWKRLAIVFAVIVLAAAAIIVLRVIYAKQTQEIDAQSATPPDTATVQAQNEVGTTAASAAQTTQAAQTKKEPTYAFTVSGSKVYATVQGGDGQTKFDAEKDAVEANQPSAGEMIIE